MNDRKKVKASQRRSGLRLPRKGHSCDLNCALLQRVALLRPSAYKDFTASKERQAHQKKTVYDKDIIQVTRNDTVQVQFSSPKKNEGAFD